MTINYRAQFAAQQAEAEKQRLAEASQRNEAIAKAQAEGNTSLVEALTLFPTLSPAEAEAWNQQRMSISADGSGRSFGGLFSPVENTFNAMAKLPGTPEAAAKGLEAGISGDASWNPYDKNGASVFDIGAGGTELSQNEKARDIGRTVGTLVGGYYGLQGLAGEGAAATKGGISQFPSTLGPAIPDVAPIAAGPGVISDFPALLPELGALPAVEWPAADQVIETTGQRLPPVSPTSGLPPVPPIVPTTITEPPGPTTVTEPPSDAAKPAPNYGKLLSSLLGNLLSTGGSGSSGGGYDSGGSSAQDKLARSLRQPSEPVTMINPNYIPR